MECIYHKNLNVVEWNMVFFIILIGTFYFLFVFSEGKGKIDILSLQLLMQSVN